MKTDFKFFKGNEKKINWEGTGLLADAMNVQLLNGVLDITLQYIVDNNLINNQTFSAMLLPIMTRLYRDKLHSYSDYDIRAKIDHVVNFMSGTALRRLIQEINENAWTGIDVEAETVNIVFENCKWEEDHVF